MIEDCYFPFLYLMWQQISHTPLFKLFFRLCTKKWFPFHCLEWQFIYYTTNTSFYWSPSVDYKNNSQSKPGISISCLRIAFVFLTRRGSQCSTRFRIHSSASFKLYSWKKGSILNFRSIHDSVRITHMTFLFYFNQFTLQNCSIIITQTNILNI